MRRLFGTDGIRGIAGEELTEKPALRVGEDIGRVLSEYCRYRLKAII